MGLTFDGVDLGATFGVIVDGASTWPKPERDVEMIHVPGRSGDILMDNGCWQNVEISYNMLIKGDWKTAFEDFAAWLCSHVGYFRLEDFERHPGVFRMASFSGPLDPELWFTTDTGVFTVTFNCKPQQYLTDGETPLVYSTLLLPEAIVPVGAEYPAGTWSDYYFDREPAWAAQYHNAIRTPLVKVTTGAISVTVTNNSASTKTYQVFVVHQVDAVTKGTVYRDSKNVPAGGSATVTRTESAGYVSVGVLEGTYQVGLVDSTVSITIDGASVSRTFDLNPAANTTQFTSFPLIKVEPVSSGISYAINDFTVAIASNPLSNVYVDCELEDCYENDSGTITNANQYVTITKTNPKELRDFPYFQPGTNIVQVSGTAVLESLADFVDTYVTITPRWYRI